MTTSTITLTGSPKQIAWATELRTDAMLYLDTVISTFTTALETGDMTEQRTLEVSYLLHKRTSLRNEIAAETSATWFIDNKGSLPIAGANYAVKLADAEFAYGEESTRNSYLSDAVERILDGVGTPLATEGRIGADLRLATTTNDVIAFVTNQ